MDYSHVDDGNQLSVDLPHPSTPTITYPDGVTETLARHEERKKLFEEWRSLAARIENMAGWVQNPTTSEMLENAEENNLPERMKQAADDLRSLTQEVMNLLAPNVPGVLRGCTHCPHMIRRTEGYSGYVIDPNDPNNAYFLCGLLGYENLGTRPDCWTPAGRLKCHISLKTYPSPK